MKSCSGPDAQGGEYLHPAYRTGVCQRFEVAVAWRVNDLKQVLQIDHQPGISDGRALI